MNLTNQKSSKKFIVPKVVCNKVHLVAALFSCKKYKQKLFSFLIADTTTYCTCFAAIEDHSHFQIPPWDNNYCDPDYPFEAYM